MCLEQILKLRYLKEVSRLRMIIIDNTFHPVYPTVHKRMLSFVQKARDCTVNMEYAEYMQVQRVQI